jgi:hypothetical protein
MKSNCWKYAHEEFNRTDGAVWVCFRLTACSAWRGRLPRWAQVIGRALVYELYRLLAFASILGYGGWSHCVVRDDMPAGYREFAPSGRKRQHYWPPMNYDGKVKVHD